MCVCTLVVCSCTCVCVCLKCTSIKQAACIVVESRSVWLCFFTLMRSAHTVSRGRPSPYRRSKEIACPPLAAVEQRTSNRIARSKQPRPYRQAVRSAVCVCACVAHHSVRVRLGALSVFLWPGRSLRACCCPSCRSSECIPAARVRRVHWCG